MNAREYIVFKAVVDALGMVHDFGTATGQHPDIQNSALDAARELLAAKEVQIKAVIDLGVRGPLEVFIERASEL